MLWVVVIRKPSTQVRMGNLEDHSVETLLSLIYKYCKIGSNIAADELSGYSRFSSTGHNHKTVDHSTNFMNPMMKYYNQNIERYWFEAKD